MAMLALAPTPVPAAASAREGSWDPVAVSGPEELALEVLAQEALVQGVLRQRAELVPVASLLVEPVLVGLSGRGESDLEERSAPVAPKIPAGAIQVPAEWTRPVDRTALAAATATAIRVFARRRLKAVLRTP